MTVIDTVDELRHQVNALTYEVNELKSHVDALTRDMNELKALCSKNAKSEMTQELVTQNTDLIMRQTSELVAVSAKKVAQEVHKKIVHMINTEIVPVVRQTMEKIDIATEDGSEAVEMYQRDVDRRSRRRVAGLITYGGDNTGDQSQSVAPYISEYVKFGLNPVTLQKKQN